MNIVKTQYFLKQLLNLKKKFPKIEKDFLYFEENIKIEPFSDLWNGVFKFRLKNSSIPVWKRTGFRLIILFLNSDNAIPLLIYSKNYKENVSNLEILNAKENIIKELELK